MNCEAVKEMLWAYLEKETTAEEAVKIEEHLKNCAECREELEMQKEIMDSLQSLPDEELPEGYHTELMQKLQAEAAPNVVPFPVKKKKQPRWKQLSLVAAAVLVVVAAGGIDGILGMRESQQEAVKQVTETAMDTAEPLEDIIVADTADDVAEEQKETADLKIMSKKMAPAAGNDVGVASTQGSQMEDGIEIAAYDMDDAMAVPEMASVEEKSAPFSMTRSAKMKTLDQVTLVAENIPVVLAEVQKAIAEAGGYEEASEGENTILAVIPAENFDAFSKALEGIGTAEWTMQGTTEEGAAWCSVEIQIKTN